MAEKRNMTRREFLRASAVVTAGAVSAACAGPTATPTKEEATPKPTATPKPEEATATPKPAAKYNGAPMLKDLVDAGELPPVDERVPTNPYIPGVAEEVGKHGGAIRRGFSGVSDRWGPTKHIDRLFVWFDDDLTLKPRLVESWEVNEDGSEWTWHFREGTKWSDGHPLTSKDALWWWKYKATNEDINPAVSTAWGVKKDGELIPMEVEAPDDYTVKMKFAAPNPMFSYEVTRGHDDVVVPGHYLKQFHMELTDDPDALKKEVEEAGYDSWDAYYMDKDFPVMNPERPQHGPWVSKNQLSSELFVMERNPYYWAVDKEGNQLPYLDKVTHRLFESPEVLNMWVVNGEIDFQGRHMSIANYSLYKENAEQGDYQVYLGKKAGHVAMQPNHTCKDAKIRELFQDRNVRLALSLAVDREEMNELVYDGLLTPRQYSPLELSPNYYPKLSKAHIEYDPDKANELLDEAGYAEKDSEGFRMWKDGSGRVSFTIEGTAEPGTPGEDAVLLAIKHFKEDIGIDASYKYFERSLYEEHWGANETEAAWWGGDRTVVPLAPGAPIFRATMLDRPWAVGWGLWFTDPDDPNAEEPPEGHWIWDIWDIWSQVSKEPDPKKRNELFEGILDIWAEQLPMIGFLGEMPAPIIVKNGFRNYLDGMPMDDTTADEHLLETETYFWEEPEKHTA